jgi:hypothetical protein
VTPPRLNRRAAVVVVGFISGVTVWAMLDFIFSG